MKNKLKQYQSAIRQGLSTRAMARVLNLPTMTAYDIVKKIKNQGNLTHGNTGRQNRKPRPDKQQVLDAAAQYEGFGISHICELLTSRDGITVNRKTLRRWLNRPKTCKTPKQRQKHQCMACFGELLQIDGSFHNWFDDKKSCLINIVDDATVVSELHFDEQETIKSACRCLALV